MELPLETTFVAFVAFAIRRSLPRTASTQWVKGLHVRKLTPGFPENVTGEYAAACS
jgi:hypothetical protein